MPLIEVTTLADLDKLIEEFDSYHEVFVVFRRELGMLRASSAPMTVLKELQATLANIRVDLAAAALEIARTRAEMKEGL